MTLRRLSCSLALLAACTAAAGELSVGGESFTPRQIVDRQQGGMVAFAYRAPKAWRDRTEAVWDHADINIPVGFGGTVENPANEEALFLFPELKFFALRPDGGVWRDGYVTGRTTKAPPRPPVPTLVEFVRRVRKDMPGLQLVGSKDLPGLPAALKANMATSQRGVAVKVKYQLKGKPVEEEFYAVHYSQDIPYGSGHEIIWGLCNLHSFRGPAGTLDRRREVFAAIVKSLRPNPAYWRRHAEIKKYMYAQWQAYLKNGYDQIAAAGQLSRQISANNDAMVASIDRQLKSSRPAASSSRGRSENDRFDDYVRGVDTVDDPYWGTSQHSSLQSYHWTDGYGSYRHSSDAGYDPNRNESGDWKLMPPAR